MSKTEITQFTRDLQTFFVAHQREMPWRLPAKNGQFDAYHILISELMLQQTQVSRVVPKYEAFLQRFPDVASLAAAPLADVLTTWQGLGYNRRAKFLWQAAGQVMQAFGGVIPDSVEQLVKLPGVGVNTAGAIVAYAHNQPVIFIETNIRTVYIHHFFHDKQAVTDKEMGSILSQSLDEWLKESPYGAREFYWALMDYGTYLKSSIGNISKQSKTYARQSAFLGSKRQVRGLVLRALSEGPHTIGQLRQLAQDDRAEVICIELKQEGLIHQRGSKLYLGV
jgi:A/G-specific adenine glycosylase